MFVCFIDFEKLLDNVTHDKLLAISAELKVDSKEYKLLPEKEFEQQLTKEVDMREDVKSFAVIIYTMRRI